MFDTGRTFGCSIIHYNKAGTARELPVLMNAPPNLDCDIDSEIKTQLTFETQYDGKFNFSYDTIGVMVRFNGEDRRAGKYVIVAGTKSGKVYKLTCFDLCQKLARTKLETRKYFAAGTPYTFVISVFLQEAGIVNYTIEELNHLLLTDREDWEPGQSYLEIVNGILDEMGYRHLYMDMDGDIRSESVPAVTAQNATKVYSSKDIHNILIPGATVEIDAFDRPNVFYYSCENPDLEAPLYAIATNDLPKDPFSIANSPRNPVFRSVDNVASQEALQALANAEMTASAYSYDLVSFETGLALHNPYEILAVTKNEFDGIVQETGWSMSLEAGSLMQHKGKQAVARWQY